MAKFIELTLHGEKFDKKFLQKYLEDAKKDMRNGLEKTSREMAKTAQRTYRRAKYDGTNDVFCYHMERTPQGKNTFATFEVIAHSPSGSVAFIEFGTGLNPSVNLRTKDHPLRYTAKPPIGDLGTYGKKNGTLDYWVFKQKGAITRPTENLMAVWTDKGGGHYRAGYFWTAGNKPARAMWRAHLYFEKNVKDNIRKGGK